MVCSCFNFTTKTRYLFEINKGKNCSNINKYIPDEDREIPFSNMIYIGDGITDVPCMKLTKDWGGVSIAVYTPESINTAKFLLNDGRINYMVKADYQSDSDMDRIVKMTIKNMVIKTELDNITREQIKNR